VFLGIDFGWMKASHRLRLGRLFLISSWKRKRSVHGEKVLTFTFPFLPPFFLLLMILSNLKEASCLHRLSWGTLRGSRGGGFSFSPS